IFTSAALRYLRDKRIPYVLDTLRRREILLQQFGFGGEEQERRAHDELFSVQNSRKAYTGMLQGLQNPAFLAQKEAMERDLLGRVRSDAKLQRFAGAWETIADSQRRRAELIGQSVTFMSSLYEIAQNLVLMTAEDQKPSEDRLREFRDSNRESLEQELFSPAPIYEDLERAKLADSLAMFVEKRGGDHPLAKTVLAGKSPKDRAAELVEGTKLIDPTERRRLAEGGRSQVEQSTDPLIVLARALEPEYRRLRQITDELDELDRQGYAQITEAKVAVEGTSGYPDATFTLRLAYGIVRGYSEDGQTIPAWTTAGGAFEHERKHGARQPWVLPESWHQKRTALDPATPFNFVSTADIIGGNSGSPVVNRAGELVGVIFDGNIQSLTSDFFYDDSLGRAVSVDARIVPVALRKIYDAGLLADELGK
ncbi:MAG TPA: S46 family peptidase, partial [Pirellulaceae bacterium]